MFSRFSIDVQSMTRFLKFGQTEIYAVVTEMYAEPYAVRRRGESLADLRANAGSTGKYRSSCGGLSEDVCVP